MARIRAFLARLSALIRRKRLEQELEAELRFHLEMETAENVRNGMERREAERVARIRLGSLEQVREECREARGFPLVESVLQDLRYAFRTLFRNPGFSLIAITSLAVGLAVITAAYSVVDAVLFRPLPGVRDAASLGALYSDDLSTPQLDYGSIAYPDYLAYQETDIFSQLAAYCRLPLTMSGEGEAHRVVVEVVSGNYFATLGVRVLKGRTLQPSDDEAGAPTVAVISRRLWNNQFGERSHIVGREIRLNRQSVQIVGVAEEGFGGVLLDWNGRADVWLPIAKQPDLLGIDLLKKRVLWHMSVGRLKDTASWAQTKAMLDVRAEELEESFPGTNKDRGITLLPLDHARFYPGQWRSVLRVLSFLMAGAGVVLLASCFNVGGLFLARASYLQRELATRMAMGATRQRVIRQVFTEAFLISILAACASLLLASWVTRFLVRLPHAFKYQLDFEAFLDLRVFGFLVLVILTCILLFALYPALVASSRSIMTALREGSSGRGPTMKTTRFGKVLVVIQIALALVVLVGAGLLARSLWNRLAVDPGFRTTGIVLAHLDLMNIDLDQRGPFPRQVTERVEELPGVELVSVASDPPLGQGVSFRQVARDPSNQPVRVRWTYASAGYFETLGIPLLQGSGFGDWTGVEHREVVVNQTAANRLWGSENPVGKRFRIQGQEEPFLVIGLAADAKYSDLTESATSFMYFSCDGVSMWEAVLLIRSFSDVNQLGSEIRRIVRNMNPNLVVSEIKTLETHLRNRTSSHRFMVIFALSLGLIAVFLVVTGLYSLISFVVSQRSREIGIRMALGADQSKVFRWILGEGGVLGVIGVVTGVVASLGASQVLSSQLYGVEANDLLTFLVASLLLMAVTLSATYFPARRACRVDPAVTLRTE